MIETFYIYADGSDLDEIAPELRARIEAFVTPYSGRVRVVDQREERKEESTNWPDWDLGVNFESETLSDAEKKDLLLFFQQLSAEFGRDFVVVACCQAARQKILYRCLPVRLSTRHSIFFSLMKRRANQ